jgi:hypothetical protein
LIVIASSNFAYYAVRQRAQELIDTCWVSVFMQVVRVKLPGQLNGRWITPSSPQLPWLTIVTMAHLYSDQDTWACAILA